jgi:hypothetical protein
MDKSIETNKLNCKNESNDIINKFGINIILKMLCIDKIIYVNYSNVKDDTGKKKMTYNKEKKEE